MGAHGSNGSAPAPGKQSLPHSRLLLIMVTLISLGCVNSVLLKELYSAYGDTRAFFVNQGVNFLYIVYGGAILYPRMLLTDVVTPEMKRLPKGRFVAMGVLDALVTFLTAMGAVFTPGSMQPLLNQTLIPWIMLVSVLYLRKVYNYGELSGAALIVVGACASALPPFLLPHSEDELRCYAVLFYALSNVPMAINFCYKERNFQNDHLDVWYLAQWVSIFQFLVSFLFVPLLCLPGFGSRQGAPLLDLPGQFFDGFLCFLETTEECADKNTFLLLLGYCGVSVFYNTLGLYLVKVASALMNALSYSILLPCTTLLFFTPLVGAVQERFSPCNVFTLLGLMLVLVGFAQYQRHGRAVDFQDCQPELQAHCQESFQERMVGAGMAHGFGVDVARLRHETSSSDFEYSKLDGDGSHARNPMRARG